MFRLRDAEFSTWLCRLVVNACMITSETKRSVEDAFAQGDRITIDRYSRFLDPILKRISSGDPYKQIEVQQFRRSMAAMGVAQCR